MTKLQYVFNFSSTANFYLLIIDFEIEIQNSSVHIKLPKRKCVRNMNINVLLRSWKNK